MAIQANFEHEHNYFKDAYIRIKKIIVVDEIAERFEEQDNGDVHLKYDKFYEGNAIAYVYTDKEARDRNVMPAHQFGVEFHYNPNSDSESIYEIAYRALKALPRFEDEEIIDI